jgi:hypothetical protein
LLPLREEFSDRLSTSGGEPFSPSGFVSTGKKNIHRDINPKWLMRTEFSHMQRKKKENKNTENSCKKKRPILST